MGFLCNRDPHNSVGRLLSIWEFVVGRSWFGLVFVCSMVGSAGSSGSQFCSGENYDPDLGIRCCYFGMMESAPVSFAVSLDLNTYLWTSPSFLFLDFRTNL